MTTYEGFAELSGSNQGEVYDNFNRQYSEFNQNEVRNGWSTHLASILPKKDYKPEIYKTLQMRKEIEGYTEPLENPVTVHRDVIALQDDIDNKVKELKQLDGSIANEKQKYTDGLTYVGVIWTAVTTTLIFIAFTKL
jgi:hypothetical protein